MDNYQLAVALPSFVIYTVITSPTQRIKRALLLANTLQNDMRVLSDKKQIISHIDVTAEDVVCLI